MKVLVTGSQGYIGVHLVDVLKRAGHEVTGCDLGLFHGCEWEPFTQPNRMLHKDVRALELEDVSGHDCVMHLAAISNDPMGDLDPELTYSINRDASIRLAEITKQARTSRFLFSSSCSVYGKGHKPDLDESDPVQPLTAYAKSKIETEQQIAHLADQTFSPVYLRNATAYGHSPMLRIDLVANNLLACALATGRIDILSDGTPWRPLVHCRDIARAFVAFMESPKDLIHNHPVNVGHNQENYQVRQIADEVQRLLPDAEITYTGEATDDPRSYRVNFNLLYELIPSFTIEYPLARGMKQLHNKMLTHGFTESDFSGDQFIRLRTLTKRLDRLEIAA